MSQVVVRSSKPLVVQRLRGARRRATLDGALVGSIGSYIGAAVAAFGLSFHPWMLGCAAAGAVAGGLLGYVTPSLLDRVRGRVPLPLLAVMLPTFCAAVATSIGTVAALAVGAPVVVSAVYGGVAAFVLTGVFWLPYTVATVMDLRRWPVVLAALLLSPAIGPITQWVWLALL